MDVIAKPGGSPPKTLDYLCCDVTALMCCDVLDRGGGSPPETLVAISLCI